jgi:hypothetical protein
VNLTRLLTRFSIELEAPVERQGTERCHKANPCPYPNPQCRRVEIILVVEIPRIDETDKAQPFRHRKAQLAAEKVEPVLVSGREMAQACGAFYTAVTDEEPTVRHLGQPELNAAVGGARKRNLADAWAWHRRDASVDISPLVAATLAVHGVGKKPKKKRKTGRAAF